MREWARAGVVTSATRLGQRGRAAKESLRPRRGDAPHILFVRPDHLGDVLLTTPAIAALRAALPTAHLAMLVGPWSREVVARNPHLDAVYTADFPGFRREAPMPRWAAYTRLLAEASRIRCMGFDAAVNFRPDFWWGAAMIALADIPVRVGFDLSPGNRGLTHTASASESKEHVARQALRLAQLTAHLLGGREISDDPADPTLHPLVFAPDADDLAWADAWLAARGITPDNTPIVLHPGSGAAVKLWRADLWARALEALASETGAAVVITGAPHESGLVSDVHGELRGAVRAFGLTDEVPLRRYAALLARARLVLGVDSGPLHVAVAVGTPSVRLHGPTDPAVFGPWGPATLHAVVASDLPCAFCGRLDYEERDLRWHPCVRLLDVQTVTAAARRVLGAGYERGRLGQVVGRVS